MRGSESTHANSHEGNSIRAVPALGGRAAELIEFGLPFDFKVHAGTRRKLIVDFGMFKDELAELGGEFELFWANS